MLKRLLSATPAILCGCLILASCSDSGSGDTGPAPVTTLSVAAGYNHSAAIRSDGSLWTWGENEFGQLGDGSRTMKTTPVRIGTGNDWKAVSCGFSHTAAIKTDGTLWAWGSNAAGQMGIGDTEESLVPVQVGSDTWSTVSSKGWFTAGIKLDGSLWTWGDNTYRQLGTGSSAQNTSHPTRVGTQTTWAKISCGESFVLALKTDGTLWSWGADDYGQLGNGDASTSNISTPAQVGSVTNWTAVAAGLSHAIAMRRSTSGGGLIGAWGNNESGQLGCGDDEDRTSPVQIGSGDTWSAVAGGYEHSIGVRGGQLWAWGSDDYHQLGDGPANEEYSPIRIGSGLDWAVVACGMYHSLAIKSDGSLWGWGSNNKGQTGTGMDTEHNVATPTEVVFE